MAFAASEQNPICRIAHFGKVTLCGTGTMAKRQNGRLVQTPIEMRRVGRGPTIRNALVVGAGLVLTAWAVAYFVFFAEA
jgi:hypothetical protein